MKSNLPRRIALLSVYYKTDTVADFARVLIEHNFEIVSSGGTAEFLRTQGFLVTEVEHYTKLPAVLGHRLVTLAPQIFGGLLAGKEFEAELQGLGLPKFDLLAAGFYPLDATFSKDEATFKDCIAATDIGGPAMVRAACKGGETIVLTKESQMRGVAAWLQNGEEERENVMLALRGRAERHVAEYTALSASVHSHFNDLTVLQKLGIEQ